MSTRYRADEWAIWLEEYRQSGLTVKEFCALIEVSVATFYNWQRKLGKQSQNEIQHSENAGSLIEANFSEVFLSDPLVADAVEIQLPAGASVTLPNDVDSLRPMLQVLAQIGAGS
jgi:hypothetical protein